MNTVAVLVVVWAILSLPVSIVVGKAIASGQREAPPIDKRSRRRAYYLDQIHPASSPKAAGDHDDQPL